MNPLNYIESRRQFYETRTIDVPGDAEYSQADLIHAINCARLSRYVSDAARDDIIGDFPYDNVSKFRIRLEARATDFDTSHIVIEPIDGSREARVAGMVATKVLSRKMRAIRFGNTLNKICDTLPEYGGVLVKKTKDGVHVVPWENVITDFSNIMGGVIIERHYLLPSEMKKMGWKNVDEVIRSAAEARKEQSLNKGGTDDIDTITDLVEVWELHGEVPVSMYKTAEAGLEGVDPDIEENDDYDFVSAQIIAVPRGKDDQGNMQGVYMQVNKEGALDETYRYKSRNPLPGRGLGQGIVEELMEHQRWHNFFKTEEARAVAIGGKVTFVTDDGSVLIDSIFDDGIDHGTIMKVNEGRMFQQVNSIPNSVPLYQNIREDWNTSGDKLTNSFAVALGSQEFSDTPYKAQYLQDINSNSQFKQYYEEISEELVQPIVEEWILPDALNEAAEESEIYEAFSRAELQLIDDVIIELELAKRLAEVTINEKRPVSPEEVEAMRIGMKVELERAGTKRSIKGIQRFIKREVLGKVIVHSSDERRNKQALFQSYSNALQLFAETDPARLAIRDRILDQMGVTKEELSLYVEEAAAMVGMNPPANAKVNAEQLTQTPKEAALSA